MPHLFRTVGTAARRIDTQHHRFHGIVVGQIDKGLRYRLGIHIVGAAAVYLSNGIHHGYFIDRIRCVVGQIGHRFQIDGVVVVAHKLPDNLFHIRTIG